MLLSAAKWHSLVVDLNLAICSFYAVHGYPAFSLINRVSLCFLLIKDEHTGLVVIQNSDTSTSVFSRQSLSSGRVVTLHIEVLIWFPSFIIDNLDRNFGFALATPELNLLINGIVVFVSKSISIQGPYTNDTWLLCFVQNFNS